MGKIYLKTYFHMPHEFKWLNLHLREGYEHVDGFIFCEFNRTHTGHTKGYIWDENMHVLDKDKLDKVHYFPVDLSDKAVISDEDTIHKVNVPLMRSAFMECMSFDPDDIIISVDADEIIYGEALPAIIDAVRQTGCLRLDMHQFFYKVNYLWEQKNWDPAIACRFGYYTHRNPPAGHVAHQWRYEGSAPKTPMRVGCHFSWVMDIDEMVHKGQIAGHIKYAPQANKENLKYCVENRLYFPDRKQLPIRILDFKNNEILPRKMVADHCMWEDYIFNGGAEE